MIDLVDSFGRKHSYLRISVTDRCNLRCQYCMPAEGIQLKKKDELLSFEEIARVARIFVASGIEKIRITGGEPLVRKNLEDLIAEIAKLPGLKHLAMTTNAVLLADKAEALKKAGLQSLNISIDSLHADRFKEITLRDDFSRVMAGIEAAEKAGFNPIKLNVVVMKGRNHDEVLDFVRLVYERNLNVRFIEYMPFKDNCWDLEAVYSYKEMTQVIQQEFQLEALSGHPSDVAKDFKLLGGKGVVSFISSMTDSFCSSCNRLRMTADGSIKSCLFYEPEINLREQLRSGCSDEQIEHLIVYALGKKPEAHPPMEELATMSNRAMVEIGG
ncbi:MAG: GTP 3',8-cyclase MoaA [Candidatus Obscuribacterales bacterium]|jgi:cyclic pyranopterin phosphate synthase|nr:GTP 3',8-cyclase MoaA [Candidatus Obscuribacterales bacterium]